MLSLFYKSTAFCCNCECTIKADGLGITFIVMSKNDGIFKVVSTE